MHKSLFAMLVSLGLMGCFPDPPDNGGGPSGGPCDLITAAGGQTAGYPYDVNSFRTNILPKLQSGCELASSCHGAGSPAILFQVFSQTNVGAGCPDVQTFNQVVQRSKYMEGGTASPIVQKINGTLGHMFPSTSPASMEMAMLLQTFIDNAKAVAGGGTPVPTVDGGPAVDGGGGGGGGDAFDQNLYATQIQPILSNSGCINTGCHNIDQGSISGDFALHPRALAGSPEVTENIATIAMRIDTSLPASQANTTLFYTKCTDRHAGAAVSNTQAIADWIATGLQ